ncbi:HD domain-containing protein [bacterium]|nr:HD domain-containing protein [bacterium]
MDNVYDKIIQLGLMLSSEMKLDNLFKKIVETSREIANSEGGSLYIKRKNVLDFIISQNEVLEKKFNLKGEVLFKPYPIALSKENIAGYAALTGEIVNIKDAYKIPKDKPYRFLDSFDKKFEYKTRSILAIPLKDREGTILGILQLINGRNKSGQVVHYDKGTVSLIQTLASFAAISLKNAILAKDLKDSNLSTIYRLVKASEYKDPDTAHHIERMSNYSKIISKYMGFDEEFQDLMLYASPMHDIGKIGVPDRILTKPGPLTVEERKVMNKHTIMGSDILKNPDNPIIEMARTIALTHHERWDGEGYPKKLKGEEIPIEGRICAIADVFDALSVKRVYKKEWPMQEVLTYIERERGKQFCPYTVDGFFKGLEEILEIKAKYKE